MRLALQDMHNMPRPTDKMLTSYIFVYVYCRIILIFFLDIVSAMVYEL